MAFSQQQTDRILGAILGAAVGDALGMPISGFSHQNVRTFYKGIKEFRDDERRGDLKAGQWTAHTQRLTSLLIDSADKDVFRRDTLDTTRSSSALAISAILIGILAFVEQFGAEDVIEAVKSTFSDHHPSSKVAAVGMVHAVAGGLHSESGVLPETFFEDVCLAVRNAERVFVADTSVSSRLDNLAQHLDEFPLDLQDRCNGTGSAADEAFPFALAMFARGPNLAEATLLSAINVGGDASAIGAVVGALLGARNGWSAFPEEWRTGLEDVDRLRSMAKAFMARLF